MRRNNERGIALIAALIVLVAVLGLTIVMSEVLLSAAHENESSRMADIELDSAASASALVQVSLRTDLPAAYDKEMLLAQAATGGYQLPAFDPSGTITSAPIYDPAGWHVSFSTDGETLNVGSGTRTSVPPASATSLLGSLPLWLSQHQPIAANYASIKGAVNASSAVSVPVLKEAYRLSQQGGGSEPGYVVEFAVDSHSGKGGRDRQTGEILLGPAVLNTGCAGVGVNISANPSSITVGNPANLTATYVNASHLTISEVGGSVLFDGNETNQSGVQTANISSTPLALGSHTFVAAVTNPQGCSVQSQVVVSVVSAPCVSPTVSFNSAPAQIIEGQPSTLSWTTNGSGVTVTGPSLNQSGPPSGSLVVSPSSDTTYQLAVANSQSGCAGATATTTVRVCQLPKVVSFSVSPNNATPGAQITLMWQTSNASSVTIDNGVGTINQASGSITISAPASSTTFTVSANSPCGAPAATAQTSLTVCPNIQINAFAATPSTASPGQAVVLSWQTTGAASVTIDHNVGTFNASSGTGSVSILAPATTTTYTILATSSCGTTVTRQVILTVNIPVICPNPAIISFSANPSTVFPGQPVTLSWQVSGSSSVTIDHLVGSFDSSSGSGSVVVTSPPATTVYTITAASPCGSPSASAQLRLTITPCPVTSIQSFVATPSTITAGGSSTLNWVVNNSSGVTVTGPGLNQTGPATGSLNVSPSVSSIYQIQATNSQPVCSGANGSVTVTVNACPTPVINSFTASPNSFIIGGSSTLQWSTSNAVSVVVSGPGVNQTLPANGSLVVSPTANATYTLAANSGCGSPAATATVSVVVNPCPSPQVVSFTATPSSLVAGQPVTLQWNTLNATSVTITGGGINQSGGASGSITVTPTTTTTYTITTNISPCGSPAATQQVTVTVCPLAVINSFTASPTSIVAGEPTTLQWATSNASVVTITGPGLNKTVAASGTLVVNPVANATYTISAASGCGAPTVSQQVVVSVCPLAVINSFTATPANIVAGQSTTLQWSTSNGSTVVITGPGVNQNVSASGTLVVSPTSNATFTITVNSACGAPAATQQVVVSVCPLALVNSFTATPSGIVAGQSTTLQWSTSNASAVNITGPGVNQSVSGSGTLVVSPTSNATYTISVSSGCGAPVATQQVTVTVCPLAVINSFAATPSNIVAGETTTLQWSTSNGSTVTITGPGVNQVVASSGTLVVTPSGNSTYTITVNSACGAPSATQQVVVSVCPLAAISSFTATPSSIIEGESTTLQWATSNAATVTITGPGVNQTVSSSGTLLVSPAAGATYTITATSGCGAATVTRQVTVGVCLKPSIVSFTASPNMITVGQSSTLQWSTTNASSVTVTGPGVNLAVPTSGSLVVSPTVTATYQITAVSACGAPSATASVTIVITCPTPGITSFTANPGTINLGDSTTISWSTSNASNVRITGPGLNQSVAASGSLVVSPTVTSTYQITASSGCGAADATQTLVITVVAPPPLAACAWRDSVTPSTLPFRGPVLVLSPGYAVQGTIQPDGSGGGTGTLSFHGSYHTEFDTNPNSGGDPIPPQFANFYEVLNYTVIDSLGRTVAQGSANGTCVSQQTTPKSWNAGCTQDITVPWTANGLLPLPSTGNLTVTGTMFIDIVDIRNPAIMASSTSILSRPFSSAVPQQPSPNGVACVPGQTTLP